MSKFRGWSDPRNLIPAKFNPLKVAIFWQLCESLSREIVTKLSICKRSYIPRNFLRSSKKNSYNLPKERISQNGWLLSISNFDRKTAFFSKTRSFACSYKKFQIIILTTREILSREIVPKVQFAKVYLAKSFCNFPNSQKFIQNKSANLFTLGKVSLAKVSPIKVFLKPKIL